MDILFDEIELKNIENLSEETIKKLEKLCSELDNNGIIYLDEIEALYPNKNIVSAICDYAIGCKDMDINVHYSDNYKGMVTSNGVNDYLNNISDIEVLSPENEQELFKRLASGDESAKDIIAHHNLRLVASLVKLYYGRGVDYLDLLQEGNIGLLTAIDKFDYTKGFKFSTYATWWIRQAMSRAVANQSRTIRIPVHFYEELSKYKRFCRTFYAANGYNPTDKEAAEYFDVPIQKIIDFKVLSCEPVSINAPIGEDPNSSFEDFIIIHDNTFEDDLNNKELKETIIKCLDSLNLKDRDRYIIEERYGLKTGFQRTLESIGDELNISRERVRQIEDKILGRMMNSKFGDQLKEFYSSYYDVEHDREMSRELAKYKSLKHEVETNRIDQLIYKLKRMNIDDNFDLTNFNNDVNNLTTRRLLNYNKKIFDPKKYSKTESIVLFVEDFYDEENLEGVNVSKLVEFLNRYFEANVLDSYLKEQMDDEIIKDMKQVVADLRHVRSVKNSENIDIFELERYLNDQKELEEKNKKDALVEKFINIIDTYKHYFDDTEIQVLYDVLGLSDKVYSIAETCKKYNVSKELVEDVIKRYKMMSEKPRNPNKKLVLD